MIKKIIERFFKKNLYLKEQEIARYISDYYVEKNKLDCDMAIKEINMLGITHIKFQYKNIYITLMRPGLLIGRRGINIDNLTVFLSNKLHTKINVKIIEDKVLPHLIPFTPYQDGELFD